MKMILRLCASFLMAAAVWGADAIAPAKMARVGTIDPRFQSFNVEMVEVTGGRFWAPYRAAKEVDTKPATGATPAGLDPSAFRQRPPIDLKNPRLRKLAAALGPSYVRVSGTWANSTYFQDADESTLETPPKGFGGVLTRLEWKGVIDFAKATNSKIVTSFAISDGTRDANGVWTPSQAKRLLDFTKANGGSIAAAEFMNEPSLASLGGAPKGYDAKAYARDYLLFRAFVKKADPEMIILGPGSVGESGAIAGFPGAVKSADMLAAGGGEGLDAFSYHFYGGVSKRCGAMGGAGQTTPEAALSESWLGGTEVNQDFYVALRDRFAPGKPIWVTETGETACGGNPWASTFLDSFRYVDQMGRLAKRGVQVVAHNTLAASDYALIDEETLTPRPDYWAALLWHKMMGKTVLDAGPAGAGIHLYAHCLASGKPGGVAVLAINLDREAAHELEVPVKSEAYSLTAEGELNSSSVQLNGSELKLGAGDTFPAMKGKSERAGKVSLAPASITFLALPDAGNASCR